MRILAVSRRRVPESWRALCGGQMLHHANDAILDAMKYIVLLVLFSVPLSAAAAHSLLNLSASAWAVPRSGMGLLGMRSVARAMRQIDAQPGSRLVIRYPGGDAGSLWASELQAWLVSLGLAAQRIERVPGSGTPQGIELSVLRSVRLPGVSP